MTMDKNSSEFVKFNFIMMLFLCCNTHPTPTKTLKDMELNVNNPDLLILHISPSLQGSVGYGQVYRCESVRVLEGKFEDQLFHLVILPNQKDYSSFINSHLAPEVIEIGFRKKNEFEPYAIMPLNGFVDKNKTSWEIQYMKMPE